MIITNLKKKWQSGETIVEVLLAIAILSSAFGVAFATASRSGKGLQANKDRYQAQLLATEQAGLLKANVANPNIRANYFCFNTAYAVQANASATNLDANCKQRGVNSLYNISISSIGSCPNHAFLCTYKVHIEWSSAKGSIDKLEVFYAI